MAIGELRAVDLGGVSDCYYYDTGMFDATGYTSVYVLDAERPAVVDTGNGANWRLVLDALAELDVAPEELAVIAPTHVHLDHAGGAGYLAEACPNAEVVVHELGAPHLVDPERLIEGTKRAVGAEWEYYADPVPVPADRVRELTDGDAVDLGDRTLEVHHVPGHAPHQVAFHDPAEALLFTADAAGIYVDPLDALQPTTPPPNFDLAQAVADAERLADLDPEVLCYPHFGPARRGDRLERYAGLLEDWVDDVAAARERFEDLDDLVDHLFAGDEALCDVWGERRARANVALNVDGVLLALDRQLA